jgi:hypothetical protein
MNEATIWRRIGPKNIAEIAEVEIHAQSLLHGRIGDLHLSRCGNGLILQGHAHSYYAKQVAQHAVMQATNLPILRNDIVVS